MLDGSYYRHRCRAICDRGAAGFTTPTLGLTIGANGELIGNAGSQSLSGGIAEPPGDTFALDQAQFERRYDPSTGLRRV
jgi:hypothetical protein